MDDLLYLFRMKFLEKFNVNVIEKGSENHKVMKQIVELWTNFATTGFVTKI